MAPTEGRVAKPERWWGCRRGTPNLISEHEKIIETKQTVTFGKQTRVQISANTWTVRPGSRRRSCWATLQTRSLSTLTISPVHRCQYKYHLYMYMC